MNSSCCLELRTFAEFILFGAFVFVIAMYFLRIKSDSSHTGVIFYHTLKVLYDISKCEFTIYY